jgi:hypothetical protein
VFFQRTVDCQEDADQHGTIRFDFQCTTQSDIRSNISLTFLVMIALVMVFSVRLWWLLEKCSVILASHCGRLMQFFVYRCIIAVQGYRTLQNVCALPARQLPSDSDTFSKVCEPQIGFGTVRIVFRIDQKMTAVIHAESLRPDEVLQAISPLPPPFDPASARTSVLQSTASFGSSKCSMVFVVRSCWRQSRFGFVQRS